jgi:hypothetical protein
MSRLDQTGDFDSKSTTLRGQLVDFAQTYGIPMGIELAVGNDRALKPIHVKSDTALAVLRRILQQQPGYDFDLTDGVANVYSTRLVNDYKNFLNLRVSKYRINEENLFIAKYYLNIAIKQTLHPSTSYGGGFGGVGLNNNLHLAKITFSGDNLTVRQILNRLVSIHDGVLWVVQLKPSKKMSGEPFYAQGLPGSNDSAPEFYWEFVPLR